MNGPQKLECNSTLSVKGLQVIDALAYWAHSLAMKKMKCWEYCSQMEHRTLKIVNNCLNTNIYSYLETSGGQSYFLYLNVVHFSTPVIIRHLW
jgi:hypothetical protein